MRDIVKELMDAAVERLKEYCPDLNDPIIADAAVRSTLYEWGIRKELYDVYDRAEQGIAAYVRDYVIKVKEDA